MRRNFTIEAYDHRVLATANKYRTLEPASTNKLRM